MIATRTTRVPGDRETARHTPGYGLGRGTTGRSPPRGRTEWGACFRMVFTSEQIFEAGRSTKLMMKSGLARIVPLSCLLLGAPKILLGY